jgi:hypothetical protein
VDQFKMPLDFNASTKGKTKLLHGVFTFIKDRCVNAVTYWKCDQCFNIKCRARVHTANDGVVKELNIHNHAANAARIDADRIVNNVKETATSTQDSGHLIVSSAVAGVSSAVAGQLPSVITLKRTIRRSRQKATRALPNPTLLQHLQIPNEFTQMAAVNDSCNLTAVQVTIEFWFFVHRKDCSYYSHQKIGLPMEPSKRRRHFFCSCTQFMAYIQIKLYLLCLPYCLTSVRTHIVDCFNRLSVSFR